MGALSVAWLTMPSGASRERVTGIAERIAHQHGTWPRSRTYAGYCDTLARAVPGPRVRIRSSEVTVQGRRRTTVAIVVVVIVAVLAAVTGAIRLSDRRQPAGQKPSTATRVNSPAHGSSSGSSRGPARRSTP